MKGCEMLKEAEIAEALDEVSAELLLGRSVEKVLQEVSESFDIRVVALKNRAEKAFGDLETYAARKAQTAQKIDEQKEIADANRFENAMAKAEKLAARYIGRSEYFGRVFDWNGEKHIFVVVERGRHVWGIQAIRVSDAAGRSFTNACWTKIVAQFEQKVAA